VNTSVRFLYYAIGVPALPIRLRQAFYNPFLSFIAIAIFDLVSLTLLLYGIFDVPLSGLVMIDVDGLKNVFYGLFFAHVIDIVRDVVTSQTPNLRELIISIFGALYSFTILESGYRIREFQRSDDDFAALGRGYNLLGRFTDYLKMTDRIQTL
jgi:hypothetical protein